MLSQPGQMPGLGSVRIKKQRVGGDRLVVFCDGGFVKASFTVSYAKITVGLGIVWRQLDSLPVEFQGSLVLPHIGVKRTQNVMRRHMVGTDRQSPLQIDVGL